jgi:GLPGLI family protein
MKKIIILFFTFFTAHVFSQNESFEVIYKYRQISKDAIYGDYETRLKTYLIGNNETSIYTEDFNNLLGENSNVQNAISGVSAENPKYYKNKKSNFNISWNHIRFKDFYIKDDLSSFNWLILEETKKILGYECQKAALQFRGRNFEVYFTTDIAISDGPWKFYGLPGLILEVQSNDNLATIDIIAEKITLNTNSKPLENPYKEKEILSRDEFVALYKTKYEESLNNVNDTGKASPMPRGFFEYFIAKE